MRVPLVMPDLDLPCQIVTASCWLVPTGREVVQGDRLLELSAGDVAVDLPSPATGRLLEKHVAEGEEVEPDRVLAIIETCDEGGGSE